MAKEENGFEKMTSENESEDGVVEHSKEQEFERIKISIVFFSQQLKPALPNMLHDAPGPSNESSDAQS